MADVYKRQQFIFQDGMRDGIALLAVQFKNDSVAQTCLLYTSKALGFTAIWITPVVQNASGYDYHGYHAMDFQHVDCRYPVSYTHLIILRQVSS